MPLFPSGVRISCLLLLPVLTAASRLRTFSSSPLAAVVDTGANGTRSRARHLKREDGWLFQLLSQDAEVQLAPISQPAHYGQMQIGTPPQLFKVIFDTGSGNVIVPHNSCSSAGCIAHTKFNTMTSSSAKDINGDGSAISGNERDMVTIVFGTGQVEGVYIEDKICAGTGACANVRFISTTYQSQHPFAMLKCDGIVGLGFPELGEGPGFNLMANLKSAGKISKMQFAMFFGESHKAAAQPYQVGESEITIGGFNAGRMTGDVMWEPLSKASYWQINVDDITAGSSLGLCNSLWPSKCQVVVDSGTNVLAGPAAFIEKLKLAANVKLDCSNYDQLPPLVVQTTGGHRLEIPKEQYVSRNPCGITFVTLDMPPPNGPLIVLGTPLMKSYYTIFDIETKKVGFAKYSTGAAAAAMLDVNRSDVFTIPLETLL